MMKRNLELNQQNEKRSRAAEIAIIVRTKEYNELQPKAICGTSISSMENTANKVSEATKLSSAAAKNL